MKVGRGRNRYGNVRDGRVDFHRKDLRGKGSKGRVSSTLESVRCGQLKKPAARYPKLGAEKRVKGKDN